MEQLCGSIAERCRPMKKPTTTPKPKRNRIAVTLNILRSRYDVFAMASEEIERRTGTAPGVEAMMEYDLDNTVDPDDLADLYCWNVLKWTEKKIDKFSTNYTGRPRLRKRSDPKPE